MSHQQRRPITDTQAVRRCARATWGNESASPWHRSFLRNSEVVFGKSVAKAIVTKSPSSVVDKPTDKPQ
jgi:hypothetical protein